MPNQLSSAATQNNNDDNLLTVVRLKNPACFPHYEGGASSPFPLVTKEAALKFEATESMSSDMLLGTADLIMLYHYKISKGESNPPLVLDFISGFTFNKYFQDLEGFSKLDGPIPVQFGMEIKNELEYLSKSATDDDRAIVLDKHLSDALGSRDAQVGAAVLQRLYKNGTKIFVMYATLVKKTIVHYVMSKHQHSKNQPHVKVMDGLNTALDFQRVMRYAVHCVSCLLGDIFGQFMPKLKPIRYTWEHLNQGQLSGSNTCGIVLLLKLFSEGCHDHKNLHNAARALMSKDPSMPALCLCAAWANCMLTRSIDGVEDVVFVDAAAESRSRLSSILANMLHVDSYPNDVEELLNTCEMHFNSDTNQKSASAVASTIADVQSSFFNQQQDLCVAPLGMLLDACNADVPSCWQGLSSAGLEVVFRKEFDNNDKFLGWFKQRALAMNERMVQGTFKSNHKDLNKSVEHVKLPSMRYMGLHCKDNDLPWERHIVSFLLFRLLEDKTCVVFDRWFDVNPLNKSKSQGCGHVSLLVSQLPTLTHLMLCTGLNIKQYFGATNVEQCLEKISSDSRKQDVEALLPSNEGDEGLCYAAEPKRCNLEITTLFELDQKEFKTKQDLGVFTPMQMEIQEMIGHDDFKEMANDCNVVGVPLLLGHLVSRVHCRLKGCGSNAEACWKLEQVVAYFEWADDNKIKWKESTKTTTSDGLNVMDEFITQSLSEDARSRQMRNQEVKVHFACRHCKKTLSVYVGTLGRLPGAFLTFWNAVIKEHYDPCNSLCCQNLSLPTVEAHNKVVSRLNEKYVNTVARDTFRQWDKMRTSFEKKRNDSTKRLVSAFVFILSKL
jgi:hypothetical protein